MSLNMTIEYPKVQQQIFKLMNAEKRADKIAFPAMMASVRIMYVGWREVAAVDTSYYKNTLKMEVEHIAGTKFLQGAVRTFATSSRGFPYPRALEDSTRYHYRSTSRRGQRTAGQVARMFLNRRPLVLKQFASAGQKLVKDLEVK